MEKTTKETNKVGKRRFQKVFNPRLARRLLHLGYTVIDIVPNRNDHLRTVFVFEVQDGLLEYIEKFKSMRLEKKNEESKKEEKEVTSEVV